MKVFNAVCKVLALLLAIGIFWHVNESRNPVSLIADGQESQLIIRTGGVASDVILVKSATLDKASNTLRWVDVAGNKGQCTFIAGEDRYFVQVVGRK